MRREVPVIVVELAEKHDVFARAYYRKPSGRPTREAENCACAFAHLVAVAGQDLIELVKPADLRFARCHMIDRGLARTTINARVNRIRRVFRWAVEEELVDAGVLARLQCVRPLRPGRSAARETGGVSEVAEDVSLDRRHRCHATMRRTRARCRAAR